MTDAELLERYTSENSEASFQALVGRYLPLVYSSALRQVRNPAMAEDVAQVVFIILARKAAHLSSRTVVPAWLFRTTRHVASRALRTEIRRKKREQEALHMQTTESTDIWDQIAPHLDQALNTLGEVDRGAIILHYFENRRLREVGTALGMTEDTAQKRVSRAVEKVRKFLLKRKVLLPAVALPGLLMTRAASAAPAYLGAKITSAALNQSALSASVYALLQQSMTPALVSAKAALAIAAAVALTAGTTVALWPRHNQPPAAPAGPSKYELQAGAVRAKLAEAAAQAQPKPIPASLPAPAVAAISQPAAAPAPLKVAATLPPPPKMVFPTNPLPRVPVPTQEVAVAKPPKGTDQQDYSNYPRQFPNQQPNNGVPIQQSPPGVASPQENPGNQSAPVISPIQRQSRPAPSTPRSSLLKKKD